MSAEINEKIYSVSDFSKLVTAIFENDFFSSITIIGEIYSLKVGPKFSYIELGDENQEQTSAPILKCAFSMFRLYGVNLNDFQKGDVVKVKGNVSYYPHGSSLTIWCNSIESLSSQLGKNLIKKKKTLEKLDKLGYLDPERKKKIPTFVNKVGIITANNSAAYSDILSTLKKQFPVSTILYPAIVQGSDGAKSMVTALKKAIKDEVDVIILGRGGGSNTDLSCFDDEELALTIASSKIPVITCIGHSIDTAIADKVADRVCITPTDAGKAINPSLDSIYTDIKNYKSELSYNVLHLLNNLMMNLQEYSNILEASSITSKLKLSSEKIKQYKLSLLSLVKDKITMFSSSLNDTKLNLNDLLSSKIKKENSLVNQYKIILEQYNIDSITSNGYIKLLKGDKKITSIKELKTGDNVTLSLKDGRKEAVIK